MPFPVTRKDELQFMREQAGVSDRNAGLNWPILIDRRIRALIEKDWKDDAKGDLLRGLFESEDAPLGPFGTRVRLGFAMGLYDENMLYDLKRIAKIRNEFAHKLDVNEFDDQPVCNMVNELKLPTLYPKTNLFPARGMMSRDVWHGLLMRSTGLVDLAPRRHKFLRSCEIVLTWLTIKSGAEFSFREPTEEELRGTPDLLKLLPEPLTWSSS